MSELRTLICCIAKMENVYLREWVEWYKSIGVTNICLYDNNDEDGEVFNDVIGDFIDSGFVIVENLRGLDKMQIPSYQMCYDKYNKDYDWLCFFDADELLEIEDGNISDFLSKNIFKDAEGIRVCWKNFDDNDLITVENNNYSFTRFRRTLDENSIEQRISKIILRGGLNNIHFLLHTGGEHGIHLKCRVVDCHGNVHPNNSFLLSERIWDNAWLNHYRFKTLEEYIKIKTKRLWPNMDKHESKKRLTIDTFWSYNKKTKQKDEYLESIGLVMKSE